MRSILHMKKITLVETRSQDITLSFLLEMNLERNDVLCFSEEGFSKLVTCCEKRTIRILCTLFSLYLTLSGNDWWSKERQSRFLFSLVVLSMESLSSAHERLISFLCVSVQRRGANGLCINCLHRSWLRSRLRLNLGVFSCFFLNTNALTGALFTRRRQRTPESSWNVNKGANSGLDQMIGRVIAIPQSFLSVKTYLVMVQFGWYITAVIWIREGIGTINLRLIGIGQRFCWLRHSIDTWPR